MKYSSFATIVLLFCAIFESFSQCNSYFPIRQGLEWEYGNFNPNGKLQGKQQMKVIKYDASANGFDATLDVQLYDKKGKKIHDSELGMSCNGGTLMYDMRKFIPEEQMEAMKNYEIQIEAENLEYPPNLSTGQSLKDGSITLTVTGSPIPMNIIVNIVDRKVEGEESVVTPAGTFKATKISGKSIIKSKMGINMTREYHSMDWLVRDVGMVKSETFRSGKSMGYTALMKKN